ncbi:hypothetical protein CANCADRAFT_139987 [Tortispora caseinolytica NRRL Y-17796]|uniref:Branched-chain-amino-acid aminotransferase n=1 Tax=Tortispora caseinolytica NRRL Y-17796 TaxID=767744 RepID=A0A1E4TCK5_9ASCO|nr:hypothetical protein CANCADRAFT_139987 [Tortispora caseinolytica NRRL Y-17796]
MFRLKSNSLCSRSLGKRGLADLSAAALQIARTKSPKKKLPKDQLDFGRTFIDHMLKINWNSTDGWQAPQIEAHGPLVLDPSAAVFHYAFECFEGLKAYRAVDGSLRLFRPDKNMARLNKSSTRIALPSFNGQELIKLIGELVKLDQDWIPEGQGYSLYLRPNMIGTEAALGVHKPSDAMLYVIASPVGPYYKTGFKAVRLEATDNVVRAWPGGVGDKKLGANYAPCIVPQAEAEKRGFQQNLWIFGPEKHITEVGTMNAFFVVKDKSTGKNELITAPLDGTILEGVTRDSILALARERLSSDEWIVSERYASILDIAEAAKEGRLVEAFGAGTAAIVSPIKYIEYHGQGIDIPLQEGKEAGKLTETILKWITDIQYGIEEHPWSVRIN